MTSPKISSPRQFSRARRKVIRPLGLDAFEVLRASQVSWGNRLLRLLGAPVPGERLLEALADQLEAIVGQPYDIFFHTARTFSGSKFGTQAEESFSSTILLEPDPDMGLISVDCNLIQGCLEALLEDEPAEVRTLLPVTPRDFGLMTFVLMELLNWLCERGLPPLSIPASPPDLRVVGRQLSKQPEIVELVYAVSTSTSAGLVRIFLPAVMVQSMEIFVTRGTHLNRQRRRLVRSRLGPLRTRLRVEAARVALSVDELRSLRRGDILMPSAHGFGAQVTGEAVEKSPENEQNTPPAGRMYLNGLCGSYFPCRIRPNNEKPWQVEIGARLPISSLKKSSRSLRNNTPSNPDNKEKIMPSEEVQQQRDRAAQMGPILEQTQIEVQVSVGEVMLSMSELAQLQSGYVLELERSIKDGVDLIVDGNHVGAGELVLVEQRLGVRVLSIEA